MVIKNTLSWATMDIVIAGNMAHTLLGFANFFSINNSFIFVLIEMLDAYYISDSLAL